MEHLKTVKVVDTAEGGTFKIINESDFVEGEHERYAEPKAKPTREQLDGALAALPGDHSDPEYVLKSMRRHYGDLFTDADEAKVRELVKPVDIVTAKATQLKALLDEKGIQYKGNASREDLLALLKAQPAQ